MFKPMNSIIRFNSNSFNWNKGRGVAEVSELFQEWHRPPNHFQVTSAKTGITKMFVIDEDSPGYEDGWDGEYWCYTSGEWDNPTKIVIMNA